MDGSIQERVEALRQEIAEIQRLNLAYLQIPRPNFGEIADHERRQQRLRSNYGRIKIHDWLEETLSQENIDNYQEVRKVWVEALQKFSGHALSYATEPK